MIIKKFSHFITRFGLNEELEPETTDKKIEKEEAKEDLGGLEDDLNQYNSLKSKIEQLYASTKNDEEISQEIEKMMPKKKGRNRFIVDYMKLCRLENEIKELVKNREEKNNKNAELLDRKRLNKNKLTSLKNIENQLKQNNDDRSTILVTLAEKEKQIKMVLKQHEDLMKSAKKELDELKNKI